MSVGVARDEGEEGDVFRWETEELEVDEGAWPGLRASDVDVEDIVFRGMEVVGSEGGGAGWWL